LKAFNARAVPCTIIFRIDIQSVYACCLRVYSFSTTYLLYFLEKWLFFVFKELFHRALSMVNIDIYSAISYAIARKKRHYVNKFQGVLIND